MSCTKMSLIPVLHSCDVTCQNQFDAEISCRVMIQLRKNVTLAFI